MYQWYINIIDYTYSVYFIIQKFKEKDLQDKI